MDALEASWDQLVSETLRDLRRWTHRFARNKAAFRGAAEASLRSFLPELVRASKVDHEPGGGLPAYGKSEAITARIRKLSSELDFRLRQFDLKMDDTAVHEFPSTRSASKVARIFARIAVGLGMTLPAVLTLFATVSVSDATSNLAGWMTLLGADRAATFLQGHGVDILAVLASVVVFGLTLYVRKRMIDQISDTLSAGIARENRRFNSSGDSPAEL